MAVFSVPLNDKSVPTVSPAPVLTAPPFGFSSSPYSMLKSVASVTCIQVLPLVRLPMSIAELTVTNRAVPVGVVPLVAGAPCVPTT